MLCGLGTTLNWIVFLLLTVLLLTGIYALVNGSITLRKNWFGPLWPNFHYDECRIEFDAITLFIDGTVRVDNPSLNLEGEQDPVVTFDDIYTNLSLDLWWKGEEYLRWLEFSGGTVYISRRHSPTGGRFVASRQLNLFLQKDKEDHWGIKLEGQAEGVVFTLVSDQLSLDLLDAEIATPPNEESPVSRPSLRRQFNDFSQKWSNGYLWLKNVERGAIDAILKKDEHGEWYFKSVVLQANGLSHPEWGTIRRVEAGIENAYPFKLQPPSAGIIQISNYKGNLVNLPSDAEVESLIIQFRRAERTGNFYILHCFMDDVQWSGYQIDSMFSRNRWYLDRNQYNSSVYLFQGKQSMSMHYSGEHLPSVKGTLTGSGTIDPMVWIEASGLDWQEEFKWKKPPEKVYSYFKFDIGSSEYIDSAYFEISARDFGWENLPDFHLLKTRGRWQDSSIHIDHLELEGHNFELGGYALISPEEQRFSAKIGGHLDPQPWSPELPQWWGDLWKSFNFKENYPELRVAASGKWGTGTPNFKVKGALQLEDFEYRDVDINSLQVKLTVSPGFLWLRDLWIRTPQGAGFGDVWRHETIPFDGVSQYYFDVQSRIPPHNLARLIDKEVEDIVSNFQFSGSTFVHGQGYIHTGKPPFLAHADAELLIESGYPIMVDRIPLDWISTRVLMRNSQINLRDLTTRMANGLLHGRANGYFSQDPPHFSLNAILDEADLLPFIALWKSPDSQSQESEPVASVSVNESDEDKPDNSGTLHLEIKLAGPWKEWYQLEGQGKFLITDGNFQRINLLGFLSAILPITSLEFKELQGTFSWVKDTLQFPDVQVEGPTTSIAAAGEYRIPDNHIDFYVKVFYLQKASLLKILSPIFHPFAHLLEVRIWGDFAKPEWRFLIDPRNLFSSEAE